MSKVRQKRRKPRSLPTREGSQLASLQGWLSRPFWTATEAAYLLTGVTPETVHDEQQGWDFHFLPGGKRVEWLALGATTRSSCFTGNFESELGDAKKLTYFEGKNAIKSPKDWVEHAGKWKSNPPWLTIAQADPECASYLRPPDTPFEAPPPDVKATAQSLGGKAAFARSPSAAVQREIELCFLKWHNNPESHDNLDHFLTAMYEKYQEDEAPLDLATFQENGEVPRVRKHSTIKQHIDKLIDRLGSPCPKK